MKKRLLIYSDCYTYGGSERLLAPLILNPEIQAEYEIHFAYRQHKVYEEGLLEQYGVRRDNFHPLRILASDTFFYRVQRLAIPEVMKKIIISPFWFLQNLGIYNLYNFFIQRALIIKIKPEILHINNGGYPGATSCFSLVLAAYSTGLRKIFYQINNLAFTPRLFISAWLDRLIARRVTFFLTASKRAGEELAHRRKFNPRQIKQLPNTVLVKNVSKGRKEILADLSWPESVFLIGQVGLLSLRKGHVFLLKALLVIREEEPELFKKIRLVLVGEGEERNSLVKFIAENELGAQVALTGQRIDAIDFINAFDVFVLPSIANEDMPLVVLEAMSRGKAIIATDLAGTREELEDGISGLLIKPNKETLARELADKIIFLYNSAEREKIGKKAQQRFEDVFAAHPYAQRVLEIYHN